MPAPKVASLDEFFARLDDTQRPHVEKLRELSLAAAGKAGMAEELKFNFPSYTSRVMVWTIQVYKAHCAVRFPVSFFGAHREEALAAGYEAIEGSIKIRYDQKLPEALIKKLLKARIADFEGGNTAWSSPGQYAGKMKK